MTPIAPDRPVPALDAVGDAGPAADPHGFTPVIQRPRSDGWTPERQIAFIEALAAWGSVQSACEHVGMSSTSAYRLRAHPSAEDFRLSWDLAVDAANAKLVDLAMDRARDGTIVPVYRRGEATSERRVYNDRLLMFMVRRHDASRAARNPMAGRDGPNIHDILQRTMASLYDKADQAFKALRMK